MAGTNGNDPLRVDVNIILFTDTAYQAFMDASNAGNNGTESNTNLTSNVDVSQEWDLVFHRKGGSGGPYTSNGILLRRVPCQFNEGITQIFP
jgi:hypothetical protein